MKSTTGISKALEAASPGAKTSTAEADRVAYARDLWPRHHIAVRDGDVADHRPAAVVWPRTTEEVARIVERCANEGIPVLPFGAGSGVCAGTLPTSDAVVLDLKRMNRVRSIDPAAPRLDVEAGALGSRLEEHLGMNGYTLGHFPSSILCSTVGGWVAARSAGQCSGLYGKIEDMVLSLECVVGKGEIVRLKRRAKGPDLTQLIVGSEGIYGVVTSAELRLAPAPESRTFAAFSFPEVEAGWTAIRDMFQAGLRPAVCRLYDAFDSWMARRGSVKGKKRKSAQDRFSGGAALKNAALRYALRLPRVLNGAIEMVGEKAFGGATLVLVFEGTAEHGKDDVERARRIAKKLGGRDIGEGPARHWFAHRYAVSYRQAPVFMSGAFSDTMEVAAPWSKLGAMYRSVREAMGDRVFVMAHFSHAYPDGCSIYFTFAGSAETRQDSEYLYDTTWRYALDAAIDAGGTLSHHHGVGRSKAPKLGRELGFGVDVVRGLGSVFDPAGIMNPGNLLPRHEKRDGLAVAPRPPKLGHADFDELSLLAWANGGERLGPLESDARSRGLTLGIEGLDPNETVASFLGRGAPGSIDIYDDPVDHLVAGFSARFPSGNELLVRPGPRKAVGPDLYSLFHGQRGAVGELSSAWLRLHRVGLAARPMKLEWDRSPGIEPDEGALIDRVIARARSL